MNISGVTLLTSTWLMTEPFSSTRIAGPLTVTELLAQLQIDARRVAVEHNLVVLKRDEFVNTTVREGDEIEIVNFVGGGECRG